MYYFLISEAPSCAESLDVGLQYLPTEDAQDYVAMHLWALVEDYLGSDEEIELDDEKKATLKSYILEFVTALPTVTNVLKAFKNELCMLPGNDDPISGWIWVLNLFDIFSS